MRLHVVKLTEGMKAKKRIKTKIRVGSVINSNFVEMEYNTREVRSSRMSKYVV